MTHRGVRRLLTVAGVVLGVLLAGWLAGPHAWAWYHLRAGRDALARHDPEKAREHLADCLKVWPDSSEAHLLSCRAARQTGDFEAADLHLRTCQRVLGSASDEVALEWALLQASGGNLAEVEEFLQRRADRDPDQALLCWEALAEGYVRVYRILDALALLDHWLRLYPDHLRALELRGLAWYTGKSATRAAEDLRRVVEIDPGRTASRWRLIHCLLDTGGYDEALTHLEHVDREKPEDPEVRVRVARCYNMLGRHEEARATLDAVLASHPDNAVALRTRGQFALADSQPAQAEVWLRKGVEVSPHDYQIHWLLFQSLQQQNRGDEAKEQLRVTQEVKDRAERLGELRTRKLSEQPLNPALHYEMGVLLLRAGQDEVGESWLLTALGLDPEYRLAHEALAEFYQRRGDAKRAEEHRKHLK